MSLFKKRRAGNIRERLSAFDDEEDNKDDTTIPSIKSSNGSAKPSKKEKKNKEKKLAVNALSFEDELEGECICYSHVEKRKVIWYYLDKCPLKKG